MIQKFPYVEKMFSLYAKPVLYGSHGRSARRAIYVRSSSDKDILVLYWKEKYCYSVCMETLIHPVVCALKMEATDSSVTLIPLTQTTRLPSWDYAPPRTKISYGIIISTVLLHAWNQTWHLSLIWLIYCTIGLLLQNYSSSFAYGTSWRQSWMKVSWRPQLLLYDTV